MAISFEFKCAMNSDVLAYGVHRMVTVHGGLRILWTPYTLDSVYLKSPRPIEALMTVITLYLFQPWTLMKENW